MNTRLLTAIVLAAVPLFCTCPLAASASTTRTQAMSWLSFLSGSWHCTGGGGPAEDDTYVFQKNMWRDADSLGGVTIGTFDAKRQKWVVFFIDGKGNYSVNEASPAVNNMMHVTAPYPPGISASAYTFTKHSATEFSLGKQTCVKK